MLTFLILLFVSGLIIGALARLALPGPDPMSILMTALLGIAGTFVGGLIAGIFLHRVASLPFAVLGAVLLLYLHRRFVQHRPLTGPEARARPR